LVTRVVPPDGLAGAALALAATLAACPPLALAQVKHGFDAALDAQFAATLARETEAELACFDTEEFDANLRRFAQRRRATRADR
jgi:enoyl-CoA hydratase